MYIYLVHGVGGRTPCQVAESEGLVAVEEAFLQPQLAHAPLHQLFFLTRQRLARRIHKRREKTAVWFKVVL